MLGDSQQMCLIWKGKPQDRGHSRLARYAEVGTFVPLQILRMGKARITYTFLCPTAILYAQLLHNTQRNDTAQLTDHGPLHDEPQGSR